MKKIIFVFLILSSCFVTPQPANYYSYYPSLNYWPSEPLYNFQVYEDPKYESKTTFVDQLAVPNGQLNDGNSKYYQVTFAGDAIKLHSLVLSADPLSHDFVTQFRLKSSMDGINWMDIDNGEVFQGLKSGSDSIVLPFHYTIHAKFLRFVIVQYFSRIAFNLAIRYTDTLKPQFLPERNSISANIYKEPEGFQSTKLRPEIPANFNNYAVDRFNSVFYYGNNLVKDRDSHFPRSPNHIDPNTTSPQALLAHPEIITEILNAFFDQYLVRDPYLGRFFAGVNVDHHKQMVVEFFRSILGGDVQYTGKDMVTAHQGMAIVHREFDRFMDLLLKTFMAFHVDEDVLQEVSSKLELYRSQIVNK